MQFIAIDIETTGQYPLESEICEIAAVRYQDSQLVDQWCSLVKPKRKMGAEVIAIHGITNEQVADAPPIADVLPEFLKFVGGEVLAAHHAPFDMGFIAAAIEDASLSFPAGPVICTSLLSRRLIKGTINHKLQTLARFFGLDAGTAHRATDDARVCAEVLLQCMSAAKTQDWAHLVRLQGKQLDWSQYQIKDLLHEERFQGLREAIDQKQAVDLFYAGGSRPGEPRPVVPIGIVRNPNGDYLVGREPHQTQSKRYLLSQIIRIHQRP